MSHIISRYRGLQTLSLGLNILDNTAHHFRTLGFFLLLFFFTKSGLGQINFNPLVKPDKSNKLYVGIDNPITITPAIDTGRSKITVQNGTIYSSEGKWIVRVDEEGETIITIETNHQKISFPFRADFIPDPVFSIGSGKARLPFIEFRTFRFCDAVLKKFDFDVHFKVLSADVYFWGIGFENARTAKLMGNDLTTIADLMNQCKPGSVVTFDNIHVEGPDGIRVIDSKSYALY